MCPAFRISETVGRRLILGVDGFEGAIRYWTPECVNTTFSALDPEGVCMLHCPRDARERDRVDIVPGLLRDVCEQRVRLPVVYTRGPETMLMAETDGEKAQWKRSSENELALTVAKPGVFLYESRVSVAEDRVTIDATLSNESSWDWRDAYVTFCCGLDPCPALADRTGDRTILFTQEGARRVSGLEKRVPSSFRPTAQYFECRKRPIPRTEEGFAFDECGVSPDPLDAGIVLRESLDGRHVLAVGASSFRSVFMDLGLQNNCIHVNPLAGDVPAGGRATLRGWVYLRAGGVAETALDVARAEGIEPLCVKGL